MLLIEKDKIDQIKDEERELNKIEKENLKQEKEERQYYLENDIKIIVDKDRKDIKYTTEVKLNDVKAPIEKGSKVGGLILKYDNNTYTYDLVIHDEVKKATFLKIFFSNLKDVVTGHVKQ